MTKSAKLEAGTIVAARYRIEREIGRGGMAQVYEARHTDIGKGVAVKVLASEFASSPVVVERFLREARAAAAVHSPYICDVYDSGKLEDGRPFLVMELLRGESLYERMVKVRQFDLETTARITMQVARGLTKAHAAGVVHRDLKPENIFLTTNEEGELLSKVLDFGLAKFYEQTDDGGAQARLTREGAIFGTPAYMSPEQVQGQGTVDHRADVWALGCIVYECLTGRTVWSTDKGIAMTFAQIASAPLPKLLRYRPDLPHAVEAWFERALARDPDARYQTAKELADGFLAAVDLHGSSLLITSEVSRVGSPLVSDELRRQLAQESGAGRVNPPRSAAGIPAQLSAPLPVSPETMTEPPAPTAPLDTEEPLGTVPLPPTHPSPEVRPLHESLPGDLGSSNTVKRPVEPPHLLRSRWPLVLVGALGLVGGAVGVREFYRPQVASVSSGNPLPSRSADGALTEALGRTVLVATASASASTSPRVVTSAALAPPEGPRWAALVAEGQARVLEGNLVEAARRFKEAQDIMSSAVGKAMLDHVTVARENQGTCRLAALARVRGTSVVSQSTGSPVVARTSRGLLVFWSDDHEAVTHDHVFVQLMDEKTLRAEGSPVDVTPEADRVGRFAVAVQGQRVALLYTNRGQEQQGMFLRWLDADGRMVAGATQVAGAKAAGAAPSLAVDKEAVWGSWEEQGENLKTDLVLAGLGVGTAPIRLTDLKPGRFPSRVQGPSLGVSGGNLLVSFRVDRDAFRSISLLHLYGTDPALGQGLTVPPKPSKEDRFLGKWITLTPARDKGDLPSTACTPAECFAAWHIDMPGRLAAFAVAQVNPQRGDVTWTKRFSFAGHGGRPVLGVNESGEVLAVWQDNNRIVVAPLTGREGLGSRSQVAHVATDRPPASVTGLSGKEWAVAWLDFEKGKLEPYLARVSCR
ncbi:MAG: protein kinase [Myxococcales bacterium]|nr:protein kinase [Polyangiaceae bacterium]MDW8250065.1 protein kinase [Myxococcales bacterium]